MRLSGTSAIVLVMVVWSLLLGAAPPARAEMGDISIGGVWVCRLTKGAGGLTLEQRMLQIERNIYAVVSNPKYREQRQVPVLVKPMGLNAAIIKQAVGPYLTDKQIDGIVSRIPLIMREIEELIKQNGESNVLY